MNSNKNYSRRDLLKQLAILAPILPTLSSTFSRDSQAAEDHSFCKRLIIFASSNGQFAPQWYPRSSEGLSSFGTYARSLRFDNTSEAISQVLHQGFNPYKAKINLLRGLDLVPVIGVRPHWASKTLNAWGSGEPGQQHQTVDQYVAASGRIYPAEPFQRSLHFQVPVPSVKESYLSYREINNEVLPVEPLSNLYAAFNLIFGRGGMDRKVQRLLQKESLALAKSTWLSGEDKIKLSAHMEMLNQLKSRSDRFDAEKCNARGDFQETYSHKELCETFIDLVSTTAKCNLSKVILIQLSSPGDEYNYSFLGNQDPFHELSHLIQRGPQFEADYLKVQKFFADCFLRLLSSLGEVESAATGASYLDNSIVYWANEQSAKFNTEYGAENIHVSEDLPVLLAGGGAAGYSTGNYLDFRQPGKAKSYPEMPGQGGFGGRPPDFLCNPTAGMCTFNQNFPGIGRPVNELLITLMKSMGLQPADWEKDGVPGFGDYSQNVGGQYLLGDRRAGLPIVYNR